MGSWGTRGIRAIKVGGIVMDRASEKVDNSFRN
jgi:hypothetical protein